MLSFLIASILITSPIDCPCFEFEQNNKIWQDIDNPRLKLYVVAQDVKILDENCLVRVYLVHNRTFTHSDTFATYQSKKDKRNFILANLPDKIRKLPKNSSFRILFMPTNLIKIQSISFQYDARTK